jgi:hypothetical protein
MRLQVLVVALSMLFHAGAFAQAAQPSEDDRVKASAHFRRGVELFQEEAFRAALAEFQRAYQIAPDYRLLYNIGQTNLELHDYLGAAQNYERYLSAGYLDISPERRTEVEQNLVALRERVASVQIVVNRDGAEISIDDLKVGTSPLTGPILVNVGGHRVTARTSYGSTDAEVINVAGGDTANVTLELAAPSRAVAATDQKKPWNRKQRAAVAIWGAAGALAVGALATSLMASSAQDELDSLLAKRDVSRKSIANERDSARSLAITTDVLIGCTAAAAVAGTLTWILGKKEAQASSAEDKAPVARLRMNMGLGSVGLSGQF